MAEDGKPEMDRKHGHGHTVTGDHVMYIDTGADGQKAHTRTPVHQTCKNDKNEGRKLISHNGTNRSTSVERDRTRVCIFNNASDKIKKHKSSTGCTRCICTTNTVSIGLSLVAIAAVTYIYFSREDSNMLETVTPVENIHGEMSKLQGHSDGKIFARFVLNQTYFNSSSKQSIRWEPITNSNNAITTDQNGPCMIVPERGTYGIFSLITFSITRTDSVKRFLHYMRLYGTQDGEQTFQRKIFAAPVPENRNNPEVVPSTLVSFAALEANGRICIDTSDDLRKFIFISRLDNTINILKVS